MPPTSRPYYQLDPAEAREHIARIKRFRILVMGRANAGKTTILQRVCNTTDKPEIYNGQGQKVDTSVVLGSLERGHHNIEDELVFASNRGFVFHDSCGFEAGSEEEFEWMKKFVMDRAKTTTLDKRIHAIWSGIPLTERHRMVTEAEKKFFHYCDTGDVPVIVLLTKADTLSLDAFQEVEELMEEDVSVDDAVQCVAKVQERLQNSSVELVKERLNEQRFPPQDYLTLTGMDQRSADCKSLLICTTNALSEEGLQQLLISTQQSNLELCMEFAIMKSLKDCLRIQDSKVGPNAIASILALWFPYKRITEEEFCFEREEFGLRFGFEERERRRFARQFGTREEFMRLREEEERFGFEEIFRDERATYAQLRRVHEAETEDGFFREEFFRAAEREEERRAFEFTLRDIERFTRFAAVDGQLVCFFASLLHCLVWFPCYITQVPDIQQPLRHLTMPALSPSMQHSMQYTAEQGIGATLVLEYFYFLLQAKDGRKDWQVCLDLAAEEYQTSGTQASVCKLIGEAFHEPDANIDILCPIFVQIAKHNQMSRQLNKKG